MTHSPDVSPQRPNRPDKRPLLSVCTVLILSGFVLGIAVSAQMSVPVRTFIILSGLTGLLAFLGLDSAAHRRRRQLEQREKEYLEHRLVKHVDSGEFRLPDQPDHEELLAIAREATESFNLDELGQPEPEVSNAAL